MVALVGRAECCRCSRPSSQHVLCLGWYQHNIFLNWDSPWNTFLVSELKIFSKGPLFRPIKDRCIDVRHCLPFYIEWSPHYLLWPQGSLHDFPDPCLLFWSSYTTLCFFLSFFFFLLWPHWLSYSSSNPKAFLSSALAPMVSLSRQLSSLFSPLQIFS